MKDINTKLGIQPGPDDIPALGVRIQKTERALDKKAGLTRQDDRLPGFFYGKPLPPHKTVFAIGDEDVDSTFDF